MHLQGLGRTQTTSLCGTVFLEKSCKLATIVAPSLGMWVEQQAPSSCSITPALVTMTTWLPRVSAPLVSVSLSTPQLVGP